MTQTVRSFDEATRLSAPGYAAETGVDLETADLEVDLGDESPAAETAEVGTTIPGENP